jgi:hypothetical protein
MESTMSVDEQSGRVLGSGGGADSTLGADEETVLVIDHGSSKFEGGVPVLDLGKVKLAHAGASALQLQQR